MPPLRLATAADLYNESIQRVYGDRFKMSEMNWKKWVIEETTPLYETTESAFSGFAQAKQLNENTSVTYVDPDQGYDVTWTQREFALGFQVTKRLWQFDLFNIIKKLPARLADAITRRIEQDAEDYIYNGAQESTTYSDADGVTVTIDGGDDLGLITESHTSESGGSNMNNKCYDGTTYNMDFAEDAYEAAITYTAPLIYDEQAQTIAHNFTKLLVPYNLLPAARRLNESYGRPGTANNDINIWKGAFEIVTLPQFNSSGTAYWFLVDDNYNDLRLKWSQKPKLEGPELVFDTGSFKYKVTCLYDLRHNDWRGWIGSKGTNAA